MAAKESKRTLRVSDSRKTTATATRTTAKSATIVKSESTNITKSSTNYWLQYLMFLAWRLLIVSIMKSNSHPDEYYQSIEVSHRLAFGFSGHLTWEWHPDVALRSFLHPLVFAGLYRIFNFNNNNIFLLMLIPRIFSAVLYAAGDLAVYTIVKEAVGGVAALKLDSPKGSPPYSVRFEHLYVLFYLTMQHQIESGCRMFANNVECAAFAVVMLLFSRGRFRAAALLLALGFCVRPVMALPACLSLLLLLLSDARLSLRMFAQVVVVGLLGVAAATAVDMHIYGRTTVPFWNFLKFNVLSGSSDFFGTEPFWAYLIGYIPLYLLGLTPFFFFGMGAGIIKIWRKYGSFRNYFNNNTIKDENIPVMILAIYCISQFFHFLLLSWIGHKEGRFLFPIMPVILLLSVYGLFQLANKNPFWRKRRTFCVLLLLIIIPHVVVGVVFSATYHVSSMDMMQFIRNDILATLKKNNIDISNTDNLVLEKPLKLLFLSQAYLMPTAVMLHFPDVVVDVEMLKCSPVENGIAYKGPLERDLFFADPLMFVQTKLPKHAPKEFLPEYLVMMKNFDANTHDYLIGLGYIVVGEFYDATHLIHISEIFEKPSLFWIESYLVYKLRVGMKKMTMVET